MISFCSFQDVRSQFHVQVFASMIFSAWITLKSKIQMDGRKGKIFFKILKWLQNCDFADTAVAKVQTWRSTHRTNKLNLVTRQVHFLIPLVFVVKLCVKMKWKIWWKIIMAVFWESSVESLQAEVVVV